MVFLAFFLAFSPSRLYAQQEDRNDQNDLILDDTGAVMAVSHENEHDHLVSIPLALEQAFVAEGILSVTYSGAEFPPDRVHEACVNAGARWGLTVRTSFKDGRLSWRFGVYDAKERSYRGSDSFAVFLFAGISSQNALESSARKVADQWRKSRSASQDFNGRFAVPEGQRFTSRQEGVMVYYGDETGPFLGSIERGSLRAPRFPFTRGEPVYGTALKEGYWTRNFRLPRGVTDKPARLPPLQKVTRHSFGFSYQFQGNAAYFIGLEYRYHLIPDRIFLEFDWAFQMSFDGPGKSPLLGHEAVLRPLGIYLLPKRDLPVRLAAGTGGSLFMQDGKIPRLFFYPGWLDVEYHFPQFILKAELKVPLLLDDFFWYYRAPPDIWRFGPVGFCCSLGVMLKW
jgi:hypothetical protein